MNKSIAITLVGGLAIQNFAFCLLMLYTASTESGWSALASLGVSVLNLSAAAFLTYKLIRLMRDE